MEDLFEHQNTSPTQPPYRVVHTADWHLGKTLGDLSRHEEHARFLSFLLKTIRNERADLLIIAGDIFDAANPPQTAQRQYYTFLSELRSGTDCKVLVIAGNHDSPLGLDAPKALLGALDITVVGAATEQAEDAVFLYPNKKKPALAVAAIPFLRDRDLRSGVANQSASDIQQALIDGIAKRYQDTADILRTLAPGVAALATGHLTVQGSTTSESERDIHIGGLGSITPDLFPNIFDYVALGHLHRPQSCGATEHIRYAGSPIPLSFSESTDKKTIRILDFANGKLADNRAIPIPLSRPLTQVRTSRQEIAKTVAAHTPPQSELTPWIELIIEGTFLGEDALAIANDAAKDRPFDIVRIVTEQRQINNLRTDEAALSHEGDLLLNDPARVFDLRLEKEESLTNDERDALRITFQTLFERQQEGVLDA